MDRNGADAAILCLLCAHPLQLIPGWRVPFVVLDGFIPTPQLERPATGLERVALRLPFMLTDCSEAPGPTVRSELPGTNVPLEASTPVPPPPLTACLRLALRPTVWWRTNSIHIPHTPVRERDWLRWHLTAALGLPQGQVEDSTGVSGDHRRGQGVELVVVHDDEVSR